MGEAVGNHGNPAESGASSVFAGCYAFAASVGCHASMVGWLLIVRFRLLRDLPAINIFLKMSAK